MSVSGPGPNAPGAPGDAPPAMRMAPRTPGQISANFRIFAVADLAGRGAGLITSPILTRLLTPEEFATPALLLTVWAYVQLAQYAGMDSAYPFFAARTADPEDRAEILASAGRIAFRSFAVVWLVFTALIVALPPIQDFTGATPLQCGLFALGLIPASLTYWVLYVLRFLHQPAAFARISLIGRTASALLVLPLVALSADSDRLTVYLLGFGLLQFGGLAWAAWEVRRLGLPLLSRSRWSPQLARKLFRYGLVLVPPAVLYSITSVLDRTFVGALSTKDQVALLAVAISLATAATMLKGWLALVWDANLVEWIASGDRALYLRRLQTMLGVLTLVFVTLTSMAAIWSRPLIELIYPAYYSQAAPLVAIIFLGVTLSILSMVGTASALIAQRPRIYVITFLAGLVANLSAALLLIPSEGAKGAAIGMAVGEAVILAAWICFGRLVTRNLPLDWRPALAGVGFATVLVALPIGGLVPVPDLLERLIFTVFVSVAVLAVARARPEIPDVLRSLMRREVTGPETP